LDPSTGKPRISGLWRVRNDKRNVVAYKCSLNTLVYKVLSPVEASIIPLFNGTNTFSDIKAVCYEIYHEKVPDRDQLAAQIDQVIDNLMSSKEFLKLDGEASPSLSKGPAYLLPDFTGYRFPAARLERPISFVISYTNRCSADCIYCYAEKEDCAEMDLTRWREIFDELAANEIYLVDIGGADIFTRADAFDILEELVSRDFLFFVSTKSYLSEDDAARMAEMGIGNYDMPEYLIRPVQVSIDSADDQLASTLIRRPQYLRTATQTVLNLLRAGVTPRVKSVLTSLNAGAPEQVVRYFADLGVKEFHFVQYNRSMYCHDDALFLSLEQKLRLREMAERLKLNYPGLNINVQDDITTGGTRNLTPEKWQARNICSGGRSKILVKPNGDVTLCEQIPNQAPFVVGNVFAEGVMGVWNSPKLLDFIYPPREKFTGTVCFDCNEFDECHQTKGYCYRDALCSYGTIYDAQPECPRQTKLASRYM
jgi:MoaA/NifB/PqqE/SkfB family radical SAM enzyme